MYSKGARLERELVKIFRDKGYRSLRIAGSGNFGRPDVMASNGDQMFIFECKSSAKDKIYIDDEEVGQISEFVEGFGGEGFFAFRFNNESWHFIPLEKMKEKSSVSPGEGVKLSEIIEKQGS